MEAAEGFLLENSIHSQVKTRPFQSYFDDNADGKESKVNESKLVSLFDSNNKYISNSINKKIQTRNKHDFDKSDDAAIDKCMMLTDAPILKEVVEVTADS